MRNDTRVLAGWQPLHLVIVLDVQLGQQPLTQLLTEVGELKGRLGLIVSMIFARGLSSTLNEGRAPHRHSVARYRRGRTRGVERRQPRPKMLQVNAERVP